MKRCLLLPILTLLVTLPSYAQGAEGEGPYVFASYWTCDGSSMNALDASVMNTFGPVLDQHVEAGDLMTWGWLAHYAGGHWDRAAYFIAPTLDGLLETRSRFLESNQRDRPEAAAAFGRTCTGGHDDYIWRFVTGSAPADEVVQDRPTAGLSTYFECGAAQAQRADDIMRDTFAPVLDALVEEGAISSWSWMAHVMGGPYTRLLVMDGASHAGNLKAIDGVAAALATQHADAFDTFGAACHTHQDYLWDIESASN